MKLSGADNWLNKKVEGPRQLNWAGQPMRPGEPYGGAAHNVPKGSPATLGIAVNVAPRDARGRPTLGLRKEERAKRQSQMMKERWARNRPEMLSSVIEKARQANLNAGQRKRRLLLAR